MWIFIWKNIGVVFTFIASFGGSCLYNKDIFVTDLVVLILIAHSSVFVYGKSVRRFLLDVE